MNGLTFFLMVAGPGLVLILNHLYLKAQSGRVSPARLDWGDEIAECVFYWPELSGRERRGLTPRDKGGPTSTLAPSRPESFEEAA